MSRYVSKRNRNIFTWQSVHKYLQWIYSKSPNVELKCPSTGKWISKLQYIHAMKHYSAIKKENQAQIYTITQINLRYILLSERKVKVLDTKLDRSLCNPMDCSPPGSSVHGILQVRILEWLAILFSRGSSWPRDQTQVSRIVGRRFTFWTAGEANELISQILFSGVSSLGWGVSHFDAGVSHLRSC